jgi:hypothetical protein
MLRKSGGPPPFAPSLKVQRDRTHNRNSGVLGDSPPYRQFPGAVRMTMGASVF